jgi:hypothetical protein
MSGRLPRNAQPRQMLTIGTIRDGFIRDLSVSGNSIDVGMTGEVRSLKTAWKSNVRDHMPTWLATLSSIDPVKKIAALGIAIFLALLQLLPLSGTKL